MAAEFLMELMFSEAIEFILMISCYVREAYWPRAGIFCLTWVLSFFLAFSGGKTFKRQQPIQHLKTAVAKLKL